MSSYYINEAVFELPERRFDDKTIHGLEAKLPNGKTLGVLVHRRPVEQGKSLRQLVDDNILLNKTRLSGYAVLDEAETSIGGVPGIVLRTQWKQSGTKYYQLQAHVAVEAQGAAGTYMIFATSGPLEDQAACDETFDSILKTVNWRTE